MALIVTARLNLVLNKYTWTWKFELGLTYALTLVPLSCIRSRQTTVDPQGSPAGVMHDNITLRCWHMRFQVPPKTLTTCTLLFAIHASFEEV